MTARWLVTPIVVLAAIPAAAAEPHLIRRGCTKPGYVCGIPARDYQYGMRSPSQMAISRTGILLRTGTVFAETFEAVPAPVRGAYRDETLTSQPPPPEPRWQTMIELYQLDQARLQIDQCEISEVALQLHDDGRWILSLRADQNRRPDEAEAADYNPRLHVKRNQFTVRLRCLGAFQNAPAEGALAAGKPVLTALDPEPFWVENGHPRHVRAAGHCGLVQEHFADIDRVEIEFFYR